MARVDIKGFPLNEVEILKLKVALDKFFNDDLHIILDGCETKVSLITDEELNVKPLEVVKYEL